MLDWMLLRVVMLCGKTRGTLMAPSRAGAHFLEFEFEWSFEFEFKIILRRSPHVKTCVGVLFLLNGHFQIGEKRNTHISILNSRKENSHMEIRNWYQFYVDVCPSSFTTTAHPMPPPQPCMTMWQTMAMAAAHRGAHLPSTMAAACQRTPSRTVPDKWLADDTPRHLCRCGRQRQSNAPSRRRRRRRH